MSVLAVTGCRAATAADAKVSPSASATTATPSAAVASGESTCKDAAGDSKSKAVDIDQVRLRSDGKLMFVVFNTVANVPTTGTVLYSVTAWSSDGKTGYEIGAKFRDGQEIANFVYNLGTNQQENITNGAVAADKQVSTRYPLAALSGLGDKFGWSGAVTVDGAGVGAEVDGCPGGEAKTQFPDA